ncbi:fasciclin-like arabinogalactan protein 8 [Syzygium oleosum]|uniref:fasciclin-like arabinogalactan protein 8 n=1 Tax=Syzygium oleosum TaxID=219896 RepID=UPI0024BA6AA2|nr:fasciclin-like arabinogalactan protein 8 [Syzygium oleosum]
MEMAIAQPYHVHYAPFFLLFLCSAHNITKILVGFPENSFFNSYVSQTKLADEINSRQAIIILTLDNDTMSTLADKKPMSIIKNELVIHVALDYFDPRSLDLLNGWTHFDTSTEAPPDPQGLHPLHHSRLDHRDAPDNTSFVNITNLRGEKVGFGATAPDWQLNSLYTKSVKQIAYNISVLHISAPIMFPVILATPAPSASDVNVTVLLEKARCKMFVSLLILSFEREPASEREHDYVSVESEGIRD